MSTQSALDELRGWYQDMSMEALLRERDQLDAELARGGSGDRPFVLAQRDVLLGVMAARTGQGGGQGGRPG